MSADPVAPVAPAPRRHPGGSVAGTIARALALEAALAAGHVHAYAPPFEGHGRPRNPRAAMERGNPYRVPGDPYAMPGSYPGELKPYS